MEDLLESRKVIELFVAVVSFCSRLVRAGQDLTGDPVALGELWVPDGYRGLNRRKRRKRREM